MEIDLATVLPLGVGVLTVVSGYAVLRNSVARMDKASIAQYRKIVELEKFMVSTQTALPPLAQAIDKNTKQVEHLTRETSGIVATIHKAPSMEHIRSEFVSKEIYLQLEKHIDAKFDDMQSSMATILKEIKS